MSGMATAVAQQTPSSVESSKAPTAFRTISEVATNLEVPQHVLRFWESKFQQIRPMKRAGGRRYYRPDDIQLISTIKDLLYNQGMTIRGVQKLLKETGRVAIVRPSERAPLTAVKTEGETTAAPAQAAALVVAQAETAGLSATSRHEMESVLAELKTMRDFLRQVGV